VKRLLASLLLLLFVLNVFGYYGVFVGARLHEAQKIRSSFDIGNYQQGSEITFRVPLTLPYAVDRNEYQRVDGEFHYHGDVYRLVKQKLTRDTLHIVCVRDNQSKKIDKALKDYVKTFTDSPVSEKNHSKSARSISNDYFSITISLEKRQEGWELSFQWPEGLRGRISSFRQPITQPPRA
jgi:hypothetical protein